MPTQSSLAELKKTEEIFRLAVESAPSGIVVTSQEGKIILVNSYTEKLFGYRREELIGQKIEKLLPTRYREKHLNHRQGYYADPSARLMGQGRDLFGLRRDGTEVPVEIGLNPIHTEQGLLVVSTIVDISERKQAEEENRSFFTLSLDMLCIAGFDGYFKKLNPSWEKTLGFTVEELCAKPFIEFIHPDDRQATIAESQAVNAGKKVISFENRYICKDGSYRWMLWSATPSLETELIYAAARDITERKRAEEALRKSEEKYRMLFDSIDVGVCTIEVLFDGNDKPVDYRFLEVNSSFEKQTGIQNAPGRRMREIAPQHEEHWFEIYGKIALTGEPIRFENQAAQLHRWYEVYAFRVGEPQKRQVAIYFNDITERKRVEEEIKKLNEDLRKQAAQLESANKELESFSYSVSHDLRTPLRSIDGFSLALLEDYGGKLDQEGKQNLARVRAGCKRMGQLIDDMLNLSRLSRTEMKPEKVNLTAVAQEVIQELKDAEPQRKVNFAIPDNLFAHCDLRLIRAVLENLLDNAWKYTSKHSQAKIELGSLNQNGNTVFYVKDDGAGFDMKYADKLFSAFQRLHRMDEFVGNGVGLATVKRVIHRHGGEVWAEGEIEKGATFYFTLPT